MLTDGLRLTEGSSIINAAVATGTAFPPSPDAGELFFRTDLAAMHVFDGTVWVEVGLSTALLNGQNGAYYLNNANATGLMAVANGGTGASTAAAARTSLGVTIGTDVQAFDADLSSIAAIAGTSGLLKKTAANTWALDTTNYVSKAGDTIVGNLTMTGSIIPSANITYDLGSPTMMWKDIYVGPGSIYMNGQKILENVAQTIIFSADDNQNVRIETGGTGNLELLTAVGGAILVKSTMTVSSGKKILDSAGNQVEFGDNIEMGTNKITGLGVPTNPNDAATKAYTDSVTVSDSTIVRNFGDQTIAGTKTFSGNVVINGSFTANSATVMFADNIIEFNADFTSGAPTEDGGFQIRRGDSGIAKFIWDETNDRFTMMNGIGGFLDLFTTGTITAGSLVGALTGNASSATVLATGRTFALSGDATGTSSTFTGAANASIPMTLATVNASVGSFGSSTQIPVVTVNAKGLVTAVSTAAINTLFTITGDVSGTIDGGTDVLTLGTVNAAPQTDTFRKVTVSGKGLVTATSAVMSSDVTGVLGYTPANKAGDTMTNLLLSADPVSAMGAATKQYVDNVASGLNAHVAVVTATTAVLGACTYNNGTSGVGATLTSTTNAAIGTVGGYSLAASDRVLIKDQASALQNGIYVVTTVGSGAAAWVLTRAADFDNNPTGEVSAGDFTYVQSGTLAGTQWVQTSLTPTIGSSNIVWSQLSGANQYTAGSGISISSNSVSNTGVLSIAGTTNQIMASASTGAITLSLPSSVTISGTLIAGTVSGVGAFSTASLNSTSSSSLALNGGIATGLATSPGNFTLRVASTTGDRLRIASMAAGAGAYIDVCDAAETTTAGKILQLGAGSGIVNINGSTNAGNGGTTNLYGTVNATITGAASLNVLKTGDTMTGALVNTFASVGTIVLQSTVPSIRFSETDQASGSKEWLLVADGGLLQVQARDDAFSTINTTPMTLSRAGAMTLGTSITATNHIGAGTGLTGTAASLSIGGSAPAGSLTGATLAANVLASSLTSVGTLSSLNVTGAVTAGIHVSNTSGVGLRMKTSIGTTGIGALVYADSSDFYILFTNSNDADGAYNTLRPFSINKTTGTSTFNHGSTFNAAVTFASGLSGALTGNASTATALQTARTISLSGAATGTATSFDGSANIAIPVTSLNAANLTGTVALGALSGTYNISISGNAATATSATSATTATSATSAGKLTGGGAISDVNTALSLTQGDVYFQNFATSATNKPVSIDNANGLLTFVTHPTGGTGSYGRQFVFSNSDDIYTRYVSNGSINAWRTLLHSGNYTSYAPSFTGTGASGTWSINISGSAAQLQGYTASTSGTANTIALRDGNGYLYGTYLNQSSGNAESGTISQVMYTNGSDNFLRKASIAQLTSGLSGTAPINISGTAAAVSGYATLSGRITTMTPTNYTAITSTSYNSAPIEIPNLTVPGSGTNFVPFLHGSTVLNGQGYVGHVTIGAIRSGSNNFASGGAFIGLSQSDSYPTEYYSFLPNGVITHSNGAQILTTASGNAVSASLASTVTVNSSASASQYPVTWNSGNTLYNISSGAFTVTPSTGYVYANSFNAADWFRSTGNTGWYNGTYATGIYSTAAGIVRTYSGSHFVSEGYVKAATNFYADGNYGYGLVGLYNASRYQGVFAMGDSYKLAADGTGPGSLYGIAWTHTNVGGESKAGLSHQALFMENGSTKTAIGSGIWTVGNITFGTGGTGLVLSDGNAIKNSSGSYGAFEVTGTKNGYSGTYLSGASGTVAGMYDASGNGGEYDSTTGWHTYWHRGNVCLSLGGATSSSSYRVYSNGSLYVAGAIVATGDITAFSDIRVKKDIEVIADALSKVETLRGVTFTRTDAAHEGERQTGLIAQEIEAVLPEAIREDKDSGMKTVAYGQMMGLMVEAIKELSAQNKALVARLEALEAK